MLHLRQLCYVFGLVIANFSGKVIAKTSSAASLSGAAAAAIIRWAIIVFSVLIALSELGIASEFVNSLVVGVIAATSLALGLAFGLGGQQAAASFLDRIRNEMRN